MSGGYSAEKANRVLAGFSFTREFLITNPRQYLLDQLIDLDVAGHSLAREKLNRRRLARLINDAVVLPTDAKTGRFASPDQLREEAVRLRAEGRAKESHYLSRMARDVRLMQTLAAKMNRSMSPTPPKKIRSRRRHVLCRFALAS